MIGELLPSLKARVFEEVRMPDGGRIVTAAPMSARWENQDAANRNIYRIGPNGELIWQIQRDDRGHMNWHYLNELERQNNPTSDGYLDPFLGMSRKFFEIETDQSDELAKNLDESRSFEDFSPGRKLGLTTNWWLYILDPETGKAFCSGKQVK